MPGDHARPTLQIKKYPNRRFYDATRSRHVTLQELHELVMQGHSVVVTDSKLGEDITNLILVQIMLEKDPPKLHLFPSWILHWMLRSNQSALRDMIDRFFAPLTHPFVQTQRQFDEMMNRAMRGQFPTPFDWAQTMMRGFGMSAATHASPPQGEEVLPPNGQDPRDDEEPDPLRRDRELRELKSQIALLSQQVDRLNHDVPPAKREVPPVKREASSAEPTNATPPSPPDPPA